jgi:hypothetical protein
MPFICKVGDTFCLTDYGGYHRYIILTEPNEDGKVVLVNFTSFADDKECTVLFWPKDDDQLFKKPTTISYANARLVTLSKLTKYVEKDYIYCTPALTKQIIIGAFKSLSIPLEIIQELKVRYPVEHKKYYSANSGDKII